MILYALVGVLVVLAFVAVCILASLVDVVRQLAEAYTRPPLQPRDTVYVRSFGRTQRCFVVDVAPDGTVVVAPAPDEAV